MEAGKIRNVMDALKDEYGGNTVSLITSLIKYIMSKVINIREDIEWREGIELEEKEKERKKDKNKDKIKSKNSSVSVFEFNENIYKLSQSIRSHPTDYFNSWLVYAHEKFEKRFTTRDIEFMFAELYVPRQCLQTIDKPHLDFIINSGFVELSVIIINDFILNNNKDFYNNIDMSFKTHYQSMIQILCENCNTKYVNLCRYTGYEAIDNNKLPLLSKYNNEKSRNISLKNEIDNLKDDFYKKVMYYENELHIRDNKIKEYEMKLSGTQQITPINNTGVYTGNNNVKI